MEISLYNTDGKVTMYIADDAETVYDWDGYAKCYIVDEEIYGWRGKHLGWFSNGFVYDLDGYRIGFTKEASPRILYTELTKRIKKTQWTKSQRRTAHHKPSFKTSESRLSLADYLGSDSP
jgi:hypothetical protein